MKIIAIVVLFGGLSNFSWAQAKLPTDEELKRLRIAKEQGRLTEFSNFLKNRRSRILVCGNRPNFDKETELKLSVKVLPDKSQAIEIEDSLINFKPISLAGFSASNLVHIDLSNLEVNDSTHRYRDYISITLSSVQLSRDAEGGSPLLPSTNIHEIGSL